MTGCDAAQDPIREEALDWLLKIEASPDDASLQADLAAWRARSAAHEQAYRSVERAWRMAADLPPDYAGLARLSRLDKAKPDPWIGRSHPEPRRARGGATASRRRLGSPRRVALGALAAAVAACLVIVLAPTLQLRIKADYMTGVGEVRKIALDDGSTLYLDAESAIAVRYDPSHRTVRLLAGQAFFDVSPAPSRPFTVPTEGLSVTVTGTGFAIDAARDSVSVTVQSGSVEVVQDQSGGQVVRLAPGDRLTMAHETGAVTRTRVPPVDIASWRDGRLVVDGMPLSEVIEQLDRYHRGVIWLRDAALAERRITGVFNLSDPVAALKAAAGTQGARVTELTPYLLIVTAR